MARTNLDVLVSRETIAQAVEQVAQSRSNLLPQITFDAAQRRNLSASVGSTLVRSGINNRFDSTLNGRLDLLNPSDVASYKAAKIAVTVAEMGEAGVRQSIMATVAATFFAHLRNIERITVLDDNISRAQSLLELARNQLNAGVATQIDQTRAESQLAIAEQARLQQDTVVQGSELQLKQLLALDMDQPLQLTPFAVRRTAPGTFTSSETQVVYERRPDMKSARTLLEQNSLEVRAARYNRLPSLALIGSYGYATEHAFDGNEAKTWSGSLALSLPVFDGARTRSLTGFALSRYRAQEMRVRNLENKISAELRLARQDASSRLAQITVAEKSFALAREELELAQKRFAQGVADNREIIEAQGRLSTASDNLVEAVYLYNLSRVELARVRGDVRTIVVEDNA
ncbi:MAG: TolC family protein [Cephaloticoccus sp.]|nr:TolC family protein [Cephaloticoccus sp.]MCF7760846.1 TolC family protein [Cephaloticoccus sp.]